MEKDKKYIQNIKFKKSNLLISAKYRSTLLENKILAIALSNIQHAQNREDGSIVASMTAAQLRKIFHDEHGSLYRHLNTVAKKMTGRTVGYSDPEKQTFRYVAVVIEASYENGIFNIVFNSALKDQIVEIENKFTLLSLPTMMQFKSVYSFRLYELLNSETFIGNHDCQITIDGAFELTMNLAELKLELGIINAADDKVQAELNGTKHPNFEKAVEVAEVEMRKIRGKGKDGIKQAMSWSDIKRRVIDIAVREINEKTNMQISYSTERSGRGGKVKAITFLIFKDLGKKTDFKENELLGKKTDLMHEERVNDVLDLISEDISYTDAESILRAANGELNEVQDAYNLLKENKTKVENVTGWLIKAIKHKYTKTPGEHIVNHGFAERTYAKGELEKLFMGL